jgi:membrane-associated phospholipid phosphatase
VAAALFSGVWLDVLLREIGAGRMVRRANWVWCVGIVYSTMATKQHVAIDVLTGMILGLGMAVLAVRYWRAHGSPAPSRSGAYEHEPIA